MLSRRSVAEPDRRAPTRRPSSPPFWEGNASVHWNQAANQTARANHLSMSDSDRLLAALNIAMADTALTIRSAKRHALRPPAEELVVDKPDPEAESVHLVRLPSAARGRLRPLRVCSPDRLRKRITSGSEWSSTSHSRCSSVSGTSVSRSVCRVC